MWRACLNAWGVCVCVSDSISIEVFLYVAVTDPVCVILNRLYCVFVGGRVKWKFGAVKDKEKAREK